jgi:hypothetical protein
MEFVKGIESVAKSLEGNEDGVSEMTRGAVPFLDIPNVQEYDVRVADLKLCRFVTCHRSHTGIFLLKQNKYSEGNEEG